MGYPYLRQRRNCTLSRAVFDAAKSRAATRFTLHASQEMLPVARGTGENPQCVVLCEFERVTSSAVQRKSGLTGRTAVGERHGEWRVWADLIETFGVFGRMVGISGQNFRTCASLVSLGDVYGSTGQIIADRPACHDLSFGASDAC